MKIDATKLKPVITPSELNALHNAFDRWVFCIKDHLTQHPDGWIRLHDTELCMAYAMTTCSPEDILALLLSDLPDWIEGKVDTDVTPRVMHYPLRFWSKDA